MEDIHPTLDQAKQAQLEALKISYAASLDFEIDMDGHTYQADQKSYLEIAVAAAQETLFDDFYWLDSQNSKVAFDAVKLKRLFQMIFAKRLELFTAFQNKKAGVRAATEINQLFVYKP